jgi:pimeloyl-ACP methyl ester carboxylesterase
MSSEIKPFKLAIPQSELDDLHRRIDMTRWPDKEGVDDWSQGAPLRYVKDLVAYWRHEYDWRRCEAQLNAWGQYKTEIDGVGIHFLHIRSTEPDALPLIMTHGWPGSVIEFNKVIGPLTNPVAHGGSAKDAFHLILPSLPGYGFSDRTTRAGWRVERISKAWIELMNRLSYGKRWAAQGGDWGCAVTSVIGQNAPSGLVGIHLNVPFLIPPTSGDFDAEEIRALADREQYERRLMGYALQQSTQPQTLGYALNDSPVGQAAWIYQRFWDWCEQQTRPEDLFSRDDLLDNIMLYWLNGTAASSARLYWESFNNLPFGEVKVPAGISIFPFETHRASKRWCEAAFPKLIYFGKPGRGGHFAAFEQPAMFTDELRKSFASLR